MAELQTNSIEDMSGELAKTLGANSTYKQNKTTKQQIIYKMEIKLSEKSQVDLKNQLFRDLPICPGCVSLLLSHPGLGPTMAELQTKL